MIKRTLSRLLLLLLLVTGFAGTISDNTLDKAERKYAAGLMKETYKDAVKAVKGLTPDQLQFKAAPEKWSVQECFYHIAAAEKMLWGLFEASMKGAANPEKRAEIKVSDEELVTMVKDRTKKADAPVPIQPKNTGYKSLDEAMADYKTSRAEHIKYIKTSTEDLRNHVVQMPFGWIDCYQLYLMIAAHSNRHTQQINEVKANAGFPAGKN